MKAMALKYLKLWLSFYSNSLTRDMEFKANLLGGIFIDCIYYGINFFFFTIIYSYVDALGVFSKEDVIIFLIITFLTDTVYMFLFSGNLFNLNRLMVKGDLDYFLLKPINSQFMISFRYTKSYALINILVLIILLIQVSMGYSGTIRLENWLVFFLSFLFGISIWYSVDFIISCSCFWFKNFSVSGWLSHEVLKFAMRPDSIYTGFLRKTLFTILPMALIASVPARTLLYGPSFQFILLQFIIALLFLILSRFMWKNGLKRYESASS
tara:strand:- start:1290 stop:2090 length:801 start_codon:yes stop_codon:yes gene_type:complete